MERRADIDFLKGFAIIGVVLYHVGLLPLGYLGVDIFLVVTGFLVVPRVFEESARKEFNYFRWLWMRIRRFLPIVVIASAVSLVAGYFVMFPNDYENLGESVFASELFSNNILLAYTSNEYWNIANDYKPLLALWYVGLVVQFFAVFPLVVMTLRCAGRRFVEKHGFIVSLLAICIVGSLVLNLLPGFYQGEIYFYLQFRLWELCAGASAYYVAVKVNSRKSLPAVLLLIAMTLLLCLEVRSLNEVNNVLNFEERQPSFSNTVKLSCAVGVVTLSSLWLILRPQCARFRFMTKLGKMSLSIFVWHQVLLAFMRYCVTDELTPAILLTYLCAVAVVSYISYKIIEPVRLKRPASIISYGILWAVLLGTSYYIYYRAGVFRDVPELGITVENPYALRNTEYVDHINSWNRNFETDRPKVLIVGESFARDFACCLENWDKFDSLEVSYRHNLVGDDPRYQQSDYIFIYGNKRDVPSHFWDKVRPDAKVYGIGPKYFGKTQGLIYSRRGRADYYNTTVEVPSNMKTKNEKWKAEWGDNYIDFLGASLNADGRINIFTPDSMFVSFDCLHLTPAGARYFEPKLGFERFFEVSVER